MVHINERWIQPVTTQGPIKKGLKNTNAILKKEQEDIIPPRWGKHFHERVGVKKSGCQSFIKIFGVIKREKEYAIVLKMVLNLERPECVSQAKREEKKATSKETSFRYTNAERGGVKSSTQAENRDEGNAGTEVLTYWKGLGRG